MAEIQNEILLLLAGKERELRENARREADRARNQAIGVLGFVVAVVTIMSAFGIFGFIGSQVEKVVRERIDENVKDEYIKGAKEALDEAKRLRGETDKEYQQTKQIREKAGHIKDSIEPVAKERLDNLEAKLTQESEKHSNAASTLTNTINRIRVNSCTDVRGPCGKGIYEQALSYLDRVSFSCPNDRPILKSWRFRRCGKLETPDEGLFVHATCCSLIKK